MKDAFQVPREFPPRVALKKEKPDPGVLIRQDDEMRIGVAGVGELKENGREMEREREKNEERKSEEGE